MRNIVFICVAAFAVVAGYYFWGNPPASIEPVESQGAIKSPRLLDRSLDETQVPDDEWKHPVQLKPLRQPNAVPHFEPSESLPEGAGGQLRQDVFQSMVAPVLTCEDELSLSYLAENYMRVAGGELRVPVYGDESRWQTVGVSNFAIARHEITEVEYNFYLKDTGQVAEVSSVWGCGIHPAVNISWIDAVSFARWLSQKTGDAYRLPTEHEWLYAAKAGAETEYAWGDRLGVNNANCIGCGSSWDGRSAAPVATFSANALGLFDMQGNVWEWTGSCREAVDGQCAAYVMQGGSWQSDAEMIKFSESVAMNLSFRTESTGFRLVRQLGVNE